MIRDLVKENVNIPSWLLDPALNWVMGLLRDELIDLLAKVLPFAELGASSPDVQIIIVTADPDANGGTVCLNKVYINMRNARGHYYRIYADLSAGGIGFTSVNISADYTLATSTRVNGDGKTISTYNIADPYNLDSDYNGIKDYMENLPIAGTFSLNTHDDGAGGTDHENPDNLHLSWSDEYFEIDTTKVATYNVRGFALNKVINAPVTVDSAAVRNYKRNLVFETAIHLKE
jgi:hypothetical protein